MEVEKRKNKRVTREEDEEERERVKNKFKGEEDGGAGVPTEEEVEEFFAILRRMRVAVKYFDHRGRGGREWREALETADPAVDHGRDHLAAAGVDDDDKPKKKAREVMINEGFDLNAVAPEAAEGGGA